MIFPEPEAAEAIDAVLAEPQMPVIDKDKLRARLLRMTTTRMEIERRATSDRKRRKMDFSPARTSDPVLRTSEDDISDEMSRTNSNNRIIPYRLIDAFIAREKPIYQQYLTGPTRVAIFTDEANPSSNLSPLEDYFTKCFRYNGAVSMFMRLIDISQLHGYGFMEIRYDISKPGQFAFSALRYEDVVFPNCDDISKVYVFYIRERFRQVDIEKLNIAPEIKEKLMLLIEDQDKETYIDKVYVNTADGYYNISYSEELKEFVNDFTPFYNGFPGSEMIPNVFPLVYDQNDELNLNDKRGRAFYDKDFQRSATVLLSAITEKFFKSGSVYVSVDTGGKSLSGDAKSLDVQLLPDTLYDRPMNFFSPPEPSMAALQAINTMETMHASSVGQINYAANNRQDSRKTATELNAAQQMAGQMSSVQLGVFSTFMSFLIDYSWMITAYAAGNGLIPIPDTLVVEDFQKKYAKRPAGDTDYVKRQEKLQQMLQMLPMIANSPMGEIFIKRIVEFAFPDEKFTAQLNKETQLTELVQALTQICKAFLASPNATAGIPPEQLAQAQQLVAAAEQDVANGAAQLAGQPPNANIPANAGGASPLPPG